MFILLQFYLKLGKVVVIIMRKRVLKCIHKIKILEYIFHIFFGHCNFKIGKNNYLDIGVSNIYKSKIKIDGTQNRIFIGTDSDVTNSKFNIKGNNNRIIIGKHCFINELEINICSNNSKIVMEDKFFLFGNSRFYISDYGDIIFGNDCMLSDNIEIRTTDSHSIIDLNTGKRNNFERSVTVGNHVWLGTGVMLLKGTRIADGCIIGAKSVLTGKDYTVSNSCIAGNPGRVVKSGVTWLMPRVNEEYTMELSDNKKL